jgi:hypothetical protein
LGLALSEQVKTTGPWQPTKYFLIGINPLNPVKKLLRHLSAYTEPFSIAIGINGLQHGKKTFTGYLAK